MGLATNSMFSVSFFSKYPIDLPRGRISDPSSEKYFFLPFLPATPFVSVSQTLEGLFELTLRLSRALDTAHVLLP